MFVVEGFVEQAAVVVVVFEVVADSSEEFVLET